MKTKGIYFLYRILQAIALPVLLFYLIARGLRSRGYWRSLPQRFGFLPRSFKQTGPGAIWLHAVSVGEVLACVEFIRLLRQEFPHSGIFVSTSTVAGQATAADKLSGLANGIFYAPVDYVFAVRRVLRTLQPSVVTIAETEIWPNLFREVGRIGAGLLLVNGRISDRAFPRYQRFRWLFRAVLPAADAILTQTDAIRERFLELGALPERTRTTGNFKYDFEARPAEPGSPIAAWLEHVRPGKVWIAASTMPPADAGDVDEDDLVIAAFRELAAQHSDLLLILAPRKPERFNMVAHKLEAAGIAHMRRSKLGMWHNVLPGVLLLDTIGELGGTFAFADVVFMGGTLARRGGHNILEPAVFGKPVIVGPHMENFRDIAEQFHAAGAFLEIAEGAQLAKAVGQLLENRARAAEIGKIALKCASARRGATGRAVKAVRQLHHQHLPLYRPALPGFAVRWILSRIWARGAARKQARDLRGQRKIDCPVISVGNLTMGGTGKTPCVLHIAAILKQAGASPGILTRGYRRSSPESITVVAPGAIVEAQRTGDEPQIFIRSGLAPVGIGADRHLAGMQLRHEFDANVMVLDDGYQHLRLKRDLDILLIDALDPFGGGWEFPLGRLREPLAGLVRADLIVVSRSDMADTAPAIEHAVRRWNDRAPVFRASIRP
ncbi:MAG TPA: tetraacyldisaccharide 4'-kinase, partial [Bryobacteraceae bacterium]